MYSVSIQSKFSHIYLRRRGIAVRSVSLTTSIAKPLRYLLYSQTGMNTLITNIGQLATPHGTSPLGGKQLANLTIYEDVELLARDGKVSEVAPRISRQKVDQVIDAAGSVVLPGFVDAHTHAVFARKQEEEFFARIQGDPHTDRGIQAGARAVATATEEDLARDCLPYLKQMLSCGTTTVEIKSGYGLSLAGEMKLLLAIRRMKKTLPITVVPTFLGGYGFPEGVQRDDYISSIITEMIPAVRQRRLAKFCDVYCDERSYGISEARSILRAARGAGLRLKLHADGLRSVSGAELAADLEATSADHLSRVSHQGMHKLKESGVIPVLLPGTAFALNQDYAPARDMIDVGLPIALASDFNPGTCLIYSMLTIIGLAVIKMGLSVEEAITAATLNAGCALGLAEEIGSLEEGKSADLMFLGLDSYRQIPYFFGHNPVTTVIKKGRIIYKSS